MAASESKGVYQLPNGMWGYRYAYMLNGKQRDLKRTKDENGNPFKTERAALRAREAAIIKEHTALLPPAKAAKKRMTLASVYAEYCKNGRHGKAYGTIRKHDTLWKQHISKKFGKRFVDDITVSEVVDYLSFLYYKENRAFGYVEAFLKLFYLIFGQAYSRGYLDVDTYNTLCVNKNTKIRMPKRKIDDDDKIISFSVDEIALLDKYFEGTSGETAYLLGRYCGLRINECYGLKWSNVDFDNNCIHIEQHMLPPKLVEKLFCQHFDEQLDILANVVQKLHTEGLRAACACVNEALGLDEDTDELVNQTEEHIKAFS